MGSASDSGWGSGTRTWTWPWSQFELTCKHDAHMHMPGATATAIAAATACTSARQGYMCARTHRAEGASCTCSRTNSHAHSVWRARALALAYTRCTYTKTDLHLLYHSRRSKPKLGWRWVSKLPWSMEDNECQVSWVTDHWYSCESLIEPRWLRGAPPHCQPSFPLAAQPPYKSISTNNVINPKYTRPLRLL